jgi:transposase
VIGPSGNIRVLVATKPIDFRKGAQGLAAVVRESMRTDPFSGVVYVFRAKRADRVKLETSNNRSAWREKSRACRVRGLTGYGTR